MRVGDWKFLFKKQDKWFNGVQQNMVTPLITNLKLDPFERFHEARGFDEWQEDRTFVGPMAIGVVTEFMTSLKDYPPRMESFSFNIDEALSSLMRK